MFLFIYNSEKRVKFYKGRLHSIRMVFGFPRKKKFNKRIAELREAAETIRFSSLYNHLGQQDTIAYKTLLEKVKKTQEMYRVSIASSKEAYNLVRNLYEKIKEKDYNYQLHITFPTQENLAAKAQRFFNERKAKKEVTTLIKRFQDCEDAYHVIRKEASVIGTDKVLIKKYKGMLAELQDVNARYGAGYSSQAEKLEKMLEDHLGCLKLKEDCVHRPR